MKHYYCTTLSKDYLYKGLLLYKSLEKVDDNFHFYFVCLHEETKELLSKMHLKNATIIPISDIEAEDSQLLQVKESRNDKEYIWTSKASAMLYILRNFKGTDHIVWLDGDTYFFSDPAPIYKEWGNYSIMLTKERWRKRDKIRENQIGIYNTGFMGFRRDRHGLKALNWFRNKLIMWCYDKNKFKIGPWSDQVYVNDWPDRFQNVGVIKNIGVNLNPYIVQGCKISKDKDHLYVNDTKLIFYHYYGFKYYDGNEFDLCGYAPNLKDNVLKLIYLPYINAVNDITKFIKSVDSNFFKLKNPKEYYISRYFNLTQNQRAKANHPNLCAIVTKDFVVRVVTMYNSLKTYTKSFHLWILCVDDISYKALEKMNLDHVTLITLKNIGTKKLKKLEKTRKLNEFCWTLKAPFIRFLIRNNFNIDSIIYLDSDIFFFKDIKSIYEDWGSKSILITKHSEPKVEKKYGEFQAGLIGFKRNKTGLRCLRWWQKKCFKWCYDNFDDKRQWADQKYLEQWPRKFQNVRIAQNKGINAGEWNVRSLTIEVKDRSVYIDGDELIAYHFSGVPANDEKRELLKRRETSKKVKKYIYKIYIEELKKTAKKLGVNN
ncbi:glycosyltransferase [Proteinivorax hydrogeniformans]|uniref:Glycosyltransferase n=1 Tax=Proteinivorax hydrogeniformans TaxID=1826727 RepID=A0AAU8HV34_9FIRM